MAGLLIGGNHEPYGFLDEMPDGGDAIDNCVYVSYRNRVRLESGSEADVRCLASMHQGREAVAIFEVMADGSIAEIWPDPAGAEG